MLGGKASIGQYRGWGFKVEERKKSELNSFKGQTEEENHGVSGSYVTIRGEERLEIETQFVTATDEEE